MNATNEAVKAMIPQSGTEQPQRTGPPRHFPCAGEPRDWEEVNERLACLGEIERQLRALRDKFQVKVAVLKQQSIEASHPLEQEKEKLERQIERFYWAHRAGVPTPGRKSVELAFGRLGARRSQSLVVEDARAAGQWLAANGLNRFLRHRTELDREALRSALLAPIGLGSGPGDTASAQLPNCPGISLRQREEFWYEVDETVLNCAPAGAGEDRR